MIYLDNNATTRTADEALAAMLPYYTEIYGNSHSAHALGRHAHDALEAARADVAALINCRADELIFTSCGSESNALVLRGFQATTDRRNVVVLAVEHPSVIGSLRSMQSDGLLDLTVVDVDTDGKVDLDRMAEAITEKTALVAVMLAQNESGIIHPIAEVAELARQKGAMVLVDAVQAAGKTPIDLKALDIDFLSLAGHKFHAPKGIGALYIRKGCKLAPMWLGGGHENGMRSGTSPVPLAVALGVASRLAAEAMPIRGAVAARRDRFEAAIRAAAPQVVIHGDRLERLPNTSLISFPSLFSDEIVKALDSHGICASGGAACDSGNREPSGVMLAMRQPLDVALGAVRFSLSRYTTDAEIEQAVQVVASILKQLTPAAVTEN
jgi:cysteine desulfurase